MAWRFEKNGEDEDIVIDGFETGIAASPHKGTANIQGGNISSETGDVSCSFVRQANWQVTPTVVGGTLTASVGAGSTLLAAPSTLYAGMWINITSTNITVPVTSSNVNALLVAGGGGGGSSNHLSGFPAGGGGAGGYLEVSSHPVTLSHAYAITVGAGGAGATSAATEGASGASSVFDTYSTTGGGGGAGDSLSSPANNGRAGGGGGGGAGSGTGGNGDPGGDGGTGSATGNGGGGGGGGSSGTGGNASGAGFGTGGNGGAGTANTISGGSVTYGGGGGGAAFTTGTAGTGGSGGGGAGNKNTGAGSAGSANTGGGGGGGGQGAGGEGNGGDGGSGVVIISYPTASMTATGGTITTSGSNTIHTFTTSGTFTPTVMPSITLPTGQYYVSYRNGSSQVKISSVYDPTISYAITHGTSGTATFSTYVDTLANPIAKAVEKYNDGTATQYRYYVLDASSYIWVYDTAVYDATLAASGVGTTWVLPDRTAYSTFTGIAVLSGWLIALPRIVVSGSDTTYVLTAKPTCDLGRAFANIAVPAILNNPFAGYTNYAFVGHQGRLYYTDGNYIGSVFPDTSLVTGAGNIQSYAKYTASTTTGTITALFQGSIPLTFDGTGTSIRIPVIFFTDQGGTLPSTITANTIYYLGSTAGTNFSAYTASSGGAAINLATGASGNQYYNTFYPFGDLGPGDATATVTVSSQRLNLPSFEIAQCIAEVGNTVLIGCKGNVVYPWNQTDVTPSSIISLPESNVPSILTVNQMAYLFAGNQGNVYITDGSVASLVLSVPDYVAGVPGSPGTYVESTYTWGGVQYLRGRVYFSILDQTSTKAGNCGGLWSFVPAQNLYIGEDTGLALRLEAQNSYNSYNGYATVLIPNEIQSGKFPLYWSAWKSSVSAPTYGIDYSTGGTSASFPCVVESDAVPVGTFLNQRTLQQVEYKLGAPLDTNATVTAQYRVNLTDAWTATDTFVTDASGLSGYVPVNFEKGQWLQLRFTLTPITSSADSNTFIRFKEIRVR